jgi:23S rRNA (guanine745-N1)-methyltransferase
MLAEIVEFLECPNCESPLAIDGGTIRCPNNHVFDIAKQGYVNFLPGGARPGTADTASMVEARDAFLRAGHYAPLAEAVASAARAAQGVSGCVADAGAGTGYFLAAVLDMLPGRHGLALDISKHAARRAARAHDRIGAVVCDTWGRLPVRRGSAAVVLDVFAPRNGGEFHRILRPRGALIVVTPTSRHLNELVDRLGLLNVDDRKEERLEAEFGGLFKKKEAAELEWTMRLSGGDAAAIVRMGPSARHADRRDLDERLGSLEGAPLQATASVTVSIYIK